MGVLFLLVRHGFTESDSIVKTQSALPALITPRPAINCQMSSCCTGIPSRTSKTRDERAATANWGSPHPRGGGWGVGLWAEVLTRSSFTVTVTFLLRLHYQNTISEREGDIHQGYLCSCRLILLTPAGKRKWQF